MSRPSSESLEPAAAPLVPGYRLIELAGRGAFGEVWLAEESLTGVRRAVKVLPKPGPPGAPAARELAGIREYQHKSRGHPSLLQIYHVGETDKCFYYAMELADCEGSGHEGSGFRVQGSEPRPSGSVGDDLAQRCRERRAGFGDQRSDGGAAFRDTTAVSRISDRAATQDSELSTQDSYVPVTLASVIAHEAPMPAGRALDIIAQVVRGLEHLHNQGLMHRDVKPSNVLFVGGQAKLGDMGLVTPADRDVTQVGTPGYMPNDATLDQTADLYAAGIMLYEMITGLHRSKFPELPVLRPKTRRERRELRAAIRIANRAAHPDRLERYATASEFGRVLASRRFRRLPRRRSVGIVTGLLAALAAGALLSRAFGPHPVRALWGRIDESASRIEVGYSDGSERQIPIRRGGSFAFVDPVASKPMARPPGMARAVGILSAEVDPKDDSLLVLRYADDSVRLVRFASPVTRPVILDLPNDPRGAIAFGTGDTGARPGRLIVFDPFAEDLIEQVRSPRLERDMFVAPPWATRTKPSSCGVSVNLHRDLDAVTGDELIVSALFKGCPTRLLVVSLSSGVVGEFWHYGNVDARKFIELNGRLHLVCTGFCNHPEDEHGQEQATQAAMLLELGARGEIWGRWRWQETRATDEVGSLKAYGHAPLGRLFARGSAKMREAEQFMFAETPIHISFEGSVARLQFQLQNGLGIIVDDNLRPIEKRRLTVFDASKPDPPLAHLWERLWPPDDGTEKESTGSGE